MSNNTQKILDFQQLLGQDHYKIPVYQRNYDWGEPQIQQLINDIQDFAEKESKKSYNILAVDKTDC